MRPDATGKRTAVSLANGNPGSGVTLSYPAFMTTDPFGNLFNMENDTRKVPAPKVIDELPVSAAGSMTDGPRVTVSSNTVGSGPKYIDLADIASDNSQPVTVAAGTPTANAQSVSVGFNTATPVTLTGSDPDSPALTLTYTVTSGPVHGTLTARPPTSPTRLTRATGAATASPSTSPTASTRARPPR